MDDRKRIVREHYNPLLNKYSSGYEILDWENRASQIKRFEVLLNNVELTNKKLLDVGCGIGDLFEFLNKNEPSVNYCGIDILPGMTGRAGAIYPGGKFITGDIFNESPFGKKQFDIVFCSGIFNLNMGDNEKFLKEALPVFFHHAKETVIFNLLDPGHYIQSKKYFFFDHKDVLHWIREYSDNVECVMGYIPNDFTIIADAEKKKG
ncbi:MAG: class I SAM-dependent methyltransferase [Spirochaetales bacterium]|nr:class I SAM-dependent methyltransferase [Spirochaetales bacterium]